MSPDSVGFALLLLGAMLLIAKIIRVKWRLPQRLFVPSSIIAGSLALLLGPDVLGRLASALGTDRFADAGLFTQDILDVWSTLPGLLISVVFAGLFLGSPLPSFRTAREQAGPQIAFGLTLASGQYVLGILLAILVLSPVFGLPVLSGSLIEMGFEGGHGTAAGMAGVFEQYGFPEGKDLALGMATVGLLSGIILGIALINWGARKGHATALNGGAASSDEDRAGVVAKDRRQSAGALTVQPASIESLSLHFGLLAVAVLVGWVMLTAMQWVEQQLWADTVEIFSAVPLFPMAMIGGILVQIVIQSFDKREVVDRPMVERLQGLSLDVLITAALGTLALDVIANNFGAFVLLVVVGLAWSLFAFFVLARRVLPDYWFERGIGDLGQSLGVTATGLVLLKIADPEVKTSAYPAFGYKQLILEPFFGGGLVTAAAIPLMANFGPYWLLGGMAVLLAVSLAVGLLHYGPKGRKGGGSPGARDGDGSGRTADVAA
ncbi:sodium/glutamate symporter [Streptomyces sp. HNM0574]|uniref:sodium/glutamate symporter n=1 Tax=Streptomyces sp. HNM0574 TaxID=2714954 RepID=UPI00146C54B3|nr:sodium/glutamate symporter [Streptomyces sp. HNM0574]NLU66975.1 sodium:glutamate symporter [Streptomyces sp. HNM0574]